MQRTITAVDLGLIIPSATNPRKYFNEGKLNELAASLKKTGGVIQAITLRPHPIQKGKYELVCGERRTRATKIAGFTTIDAEIKQLTDDEVTEIQFIENIEREDVHPMDEAVTFQAMRTHKTKPWSVADIAAKINKPESYVVQRLQLVNLIPALQKEFWDDKFLIGHAIQFARLTAADQKTCFESKRNGQYGSVADAKEFIERNIMQHLSAAPFDKKDPQLVPAAGACINCQKRSGCNVLLFDDVKQDDRCFDKKCFSEKMVAHLLVTIEKTILEKPDIVMMQHGGINPVPAVLSLLKKHDVKLLSNWSNDVHSYKSNGMVEIKCLMLSGPGDVGKIKTYYQTSKNKTLAAAAKSGSPVKISAAMIDEQISGINDRLKRGVELDYEKVQERIVKSVEETFPDTALIEIPISADLKKVLLNFLLYDLAAKWDDEFLKIIGLEDPEDNDYSKTPELLYNKLLQLTSTQEATLLKHVIESRFSKNRHLDNDGCFMFRQMATWLGIPVADFIADQQIIRSKREINAEKRVADLLEQKDALKKPAPKPAAAAKKVAPGANKVAKKAAPKKAAKKPVSKKPAAKKAATKKKAA